MTRSASPKLGAYAGLAALGLIASLAVGRPELAVLAAPFALLPALALVASRPPELEVSMVLDRDRMAEGEEVVAAITLEASRTAGRLELLLALPREFEVIEAPLAVPHSGGAGLPRLRRKRQVDTPAVRTKRIEPRNPVAVRLRKGERRELELTLRCTRWGGYRVGEVLIRAHDRLGFLSYEAHFDRRAPLKVYPTPETVRSLLRPFDTQVYSGNYVARQRGEGIEFADLRPFVPGDRIRHVNWRASARLQELWVNVHHPERNADVVIFVDSFAEARRGGEGTLDLAVRASAALAGQYLAHKDRVGFVSFGGRLNWLLPGTGLVQLYRIVDSLLDTEVVLNYAWKGLEVIPSRTLPPQALVLALTPLVDDRAGDALLNLRARGFDLAVIEVSPVPFTPPGRGESAALAYRLWQLEREALRGRFEQVGVPVVVWDERKPLVAAIEEVSSFRRYARHARA